MQTAFITATPVPARASVLSAQSAAISPRRATSQPKWTMGKQAKFGPFTPAVIATRIVIGEKRLNKLRGKGISLHSQAITAFCDFTGAGPRMRQSLIRTAKENGNTLGFLS